MRTGGDDKRLTPITEPTLRGEVAPWRPMYIRVPYQASIFTLSNRTMETGVYFQAPFFRNPMDHFVVIDLDRVE